MNSVKTFCGGLKDAARTGWNSPRGKRVIVHSTMATVSAGILFMSAIEPAAAQNLQALQNAADRIVQFFTGPFRAQHRRHRLHRHVSGRGVKLGWGAPAIGGSLASMLRGVLSFWPAARGNAFTTWQTGRRRDRGYSGHPQHGRNHGLLPSFSPSASLMMRYAALGSALVHGAFIVQRGLAAS